MLGVAGAFAGASPAAAFSTQGYKWANPAGTPVTYMLEPNGSPEVTDGTDLEALRKAFGTWQSVACSYLTFAEQPWQGPGSVSADRMNQIMWITDAGLWPAGQQATLAFTYTFYDTGSGAITDADIIANSVNWQWTTVDADVTPQKVDLETVMFHEIGHFFGLAHSTDQDAVMFPSNNKGIQRAPRIDDINGICSLYPNGQPAPTNPDNPTQPGQQGTGQVGSPCQANVDCVSSLCAEDPLIGRNYCTAPCTAGRADGCPAGYDCTPTSADTAYCLAPVPVDELCDQCSASAQCSSGLCLQVPGYNSFQPFCTRACDPTPGAASCPEGYRCELVDGLGQSGGVCSPIEGVCNPRGRGGHNEPCFSNGGCKPNHICAEYFSGSGLKFCYLECSTGQIGQPCARDIPNLVCLPVVDRDNVAACFDLVPIGGPCIPEVCGGSDSGCFFDENLGIDSALCYQFCSGQLSCPANTQCSNEGLCIPSMGFKYLGEACLSDAECESRTCRTYGENQLCTKSCTITDATSCDAGFKCLPREGSIDGLCWPLTFTNSTAENRREIKTSVTKPDYCSCDSTNSCDEGCACDPECGGGCSCRAPSGSTAATLASSMLLFAGLATVLCVRRRTK